MRTSFRGYSYLNVHGGISPLEVSIVNSNVPGGAPRVKLGWKRVWLTYSLGVKSDFNGCVKI